VVMLAMTLIQVPRFIDQLSFPGPGSAFYTSAPTASSHSRGAPKNR
jgi:hypothetical protein